MKIHYTADALFSRTSSYDPAFRLLTPEAEAWWAEHVGALYSLEDGAYIVQADAHAADIFLDMAESGLRIATRRGVTVVGHINGSNDD